MQKEIERILKQKKGQKHRCEKCQPALSQQEQEEIERILKQKKEQKQRRENQHKLKLEKCQPALSQSTYETLKRARQMQFEIRNLDNNKIVKSHEKVIFGVSENPHGNDWDYD